MTKLGFDLFVNFEEISKKIYFSKANTLNVIKLTQIRGKRREVLKSAHFYLAKIPQKVVFF